MGVPEGRKVADVLTAELFGMNGGSEMSGVFRIICLICDSKTGTLRRIKPYEIYACDGCVRKEGFEEIQRRAPEYVAAFEGRHPGKTV